VLSSKLLNEMKVGGYLLCVTHDLIVNWGIRNRTTDGYISGIEINIIILRIWNHVQRF